MLGPNTLLVIAGLFNAEQYVLSFGGTSYVSEARMAGQEGVNRRNLEPEEFLPLDPGRRKLALELIAALGGLSR